MTTVYVYVPAVAHDKAGHPESKQRIETLWQRLEPFGILPDLRPLTPKLADVNTLLRVHSSGVVERVRQVAHAGGGLLDHGDTYATAESYDLARMAVGATCTAVDAIMTGAADNGFALVRPPGHHAEQNRISGFCLFNNVAAAARHAQDVHGLERVAIVDFDVHHGNGTQDIFYDDPSVLFASTHLYIPRFFYPGSGNSGEQGSGRGQGYTLNVPLPPHVGDVGYDHFFKELIGPKLRAFQPQLLLVSAGFDAHWQDPLAMAGLSLTGYAELARYLVELAQSVCNGRILFVLEGGYQVDALAYGILNVFRALLGQDEITDPLGAMPDNEQDVTDLLYHLQQHHLLF